MTSEGGKFANLMESSAGTWPQRLSNIEDTLFQKMNEFGNKYKEVLSLVSVQRRIWWKVLMM